MRFLESLYSSFENISSPVFGNDVSSSPKSSEVGRFVVATRSSMNPTHYAIFTGPFEFPDSLELGPEKEVIASRDHFEDTRKRIQSSERNFEYRFAALQYAQGMLILTASALELPQLYSGRCTTGKVHNDAEISEIEHCIVVNADGESDGSHPLFYASLVNKTCSHLRKVLKAVGGGSGPMGRTES